MRIAASLVAGLLVVLSLAGCNSRYDDCKKAATEYCDLEEFDRSPIDPVRKKCVARHTLVCVREKK